MGYDDLLAGTEPLPNAGSLVPQGWLSDLTSAVGSIAAAALPAVGSYFQNQMAIKGQMARAQSQVGGPPMLSYPGLGYSSNQLPVQPTGSIQFYAGDQGGNVMPMPGGGQMSGVTGGGSSTASGGFVVRTGPAQRATAQKLIMNQNPINGRIHVWYHVGGLDMLVRRGLEACGYGHTRRRARRRPGRRRPC